MVKVLFIIQVSLVLLVMIVCPTRTDEANAEMVENFVSHYYLKPDPQRVPSILDIVLKDLGDQEDVQNVLVGHAFGHMARGNQKLIRLYESRFLNATDTGRVFLVEALRICGDDLTRDKLEKWSRDPAYKHQQRRLESAVTFLADRKRRLPRDRPAETPMDLDLLWADFFTTGEYAPVARILDTLDQPGELRQKIDECLKRKSGREELVEELNKLKLIQAGTKDKLADGDLEMILFHDAKGRFKPMAIEAAVYLGREILDLSDDELNRGLLLRGTAGWSLEDNLKQHPVLAELMKKHYRERPARSRELIKKWLRIDQPKVVLDKGSEQLQGTWQATAWEDDGSSDDSKLGAQILRYVRWKFEDDELTQTKALTLDERKVIGEGTTWISTYKVDASKRPKVMTWTSISPEEGNITRCIYEVEGDILRVCIGKKHQIPSNFSAKRGSDCILATLKKATAKAVEGPTK